MLGQKASPLKAGLLSAMKQRLFAPCVRSELASMALESTAGRLGEVGEKGFECGGHFLWPLYLSCMSWVI